MESWELLKLVNTMQNKKYEEKIYFWKHSDYCEYFGKEKNNISLYEYLHYSILERINLYIYSYVKTISSKDPLFDKYDIMIESYVYFTNKKTDNPTMLDLSNFLANMYRGIKADKRKVEKVDISKLELSAGIIDLDSKMVIGGLLSTLKEEDRNIIYLYFFEGHTYDSITELCSIKTKRGVKKRIDSILKKLRDTL